MVLATVKHHHLKETHMSHTHTHIYIYIIVIHMYLVDTFVPTDSTCLWCGWKTSQEKNLSLLGSPCSVPKYWCCHCHPEKLTTDGSKGLRFGSFGPRVEGKSPNCRRKPLIYTMVYIHPGKLTCPLKRDHFNRKYIFQPSIFRGHVSFPECIPFKGAENIFLIYSLPPITRMIHWSTGCFERTVCICGKWNFAWIKRSSEDVFLVEWTHTGQVLKISEECFRLLSYCFIFYKNFNIPLTPLLGSFCLVRKLKPDPYDYLIRSDLVN